MMRTLTYALCAALGVAITSGAAIAGNVMAQAQWGSLEIDGSAEPILGMTYGPNGLEFQVRSTGCTEKDDFVVQRLTSSGQTTSQLLLIRVVEDFCDAYVPFGVRISFSYKELGVEEDDMFTVLNPRSPYRVECFE